jgi:glycosyltransferase involved in cell wall biosynthesis
MKILLVSKEWFPTNCTGLGIASKMHEKILRMNGNEVRTVSTNLNCQTDYFINIYNFGHAILNYFIFNRKIKNIIDTFKPDLIILESLQTVISEFFLLIKYRKNIKIILFSHGISILPYKFNFKFLLRFLIYLFYLPVMYFFLKRVDIFYSLNWTNRSNRHLDEKIYKISNKYGLIKKYFNTSRFEVPESLIKKQAKKKKIVSCFGYIGDIKNQKEALKIANKFILSDVTFKFIFQSYDKKYFNSCKNYCKNKNLHNVQFIESKEVDIKKEIEDSYLILNTSITEVFPLSIVEAISLGVPFISYDTGNISYIKGGLISKNIFEMERNIKLLLNNDFFYKKISTIGRDFYHKNLSNVLLEDKFKELQGI